MTILRPATTRNTAHTTNGTRWNVNLVISNGNTLFLTANYNQTLTIRNLKINTCHFSVTRRVTHRTRRITTRIHRYTANVFNLATPQPKKHQVNRRIFTRFTLGTSSLARSTTLGRLPHRTSSKIILMIMTSSNSRTHVLNNRIRNVNLFGIRHRQFFTMRHFTDQRHNRNRQMIRIIKNNSNSRISLKIVSRLLPITVNLFGIPDNNAYLNAGKVNINRNNRTRHGKRFRYYTSITGNRNVNATRRAYTSGSSSRFTRSEVL